MSVPHPAGQDGNHTTEGCPTCSPVVRADIPLETYWTDRTAALAEALHENAPEAQTPAEDLRLYFQLRGWSITMDDREGQAVYPFRDLENWIVRSGLPDAKDALLYLREHGWTLEREERP